MNTNRSSAQGSSASAGLDALLQQQAQNQGRNASSSDAAAFERWMAQYRPPVPTVQPAATPTVNPSANTHSSPSPSPSTSISTSPSPNTARAAQAHAQPAVTASQDTAHHSPQASAQRTPAKEVRKPAQGPVRPSDAAQGKPAQVANQATKGETDETASADALPEDQASAVSFQTAQGEGSAWVRELPVPDDVATGDPAAMLAWLASLHNPAQAAPGSEAVATEAASATGAPANARGAEGSTPAGRHAGAEALTLQALQRVGAAAGQGGEPGTGAGGDTDHGRGALSLEGLSLTKAGETLGDAAGAASFASALQRELTPAGATRTEATPRHYTGNLHTPMDSPAFTQALSDRVAFWVNGPAAEGPMTAELRLNPAEMGPVHIRIELDGQNAQIDFAATAAETRQAIEASLGQLSAALEESGLKLSGGGVSDQTPQQQAWAQAAAGQSDGSGQPGRGRGQGSSASGRWVQVGTPEGVSETLGARPGRPGRAGGLDLYA